MTSDARSEVLSRIRSANGRDGDLSLATAAWDGLERQYIQASSLTHEECLGLLTDRLLDYGAQVVRCDEAEIPSLILKILSEDRMHRMVMPAGFPARLLPEGIAVTTDTGFTGSELDAFDAAVTECSLAIAETGTLILAGVPGQGRRAMSLVPDALLCILRAEAVVATVPEAWVRLESLSSVPLTLVSGPSATSDIEMTRIQGVHGPRRLYVLLLGSNS